MSTALSAGSLSRQIARAQSSLARRAGLAGGVTRPGFGNLRRKGHSGFAGKSLLAGIIPSEVKPVPVIMGVGVGVGFSTVVARLLESPRLGIGMNPLLARSGMLLTGGVLHALFQGNFTLGFFVGQVPALIDIGVSWVMDQFLGEQTVMKGASAGMGKVSQEALAELQNLRKKLDATPAPAAPGKVPMGVRAKAAA